MADRARSGRSLTRPSTSAAMSGSGNRWRSITAARRPEAKEGRCSSSSARVSRRAKTCARELARTCSTRSSSPESAYCMSSKSSTTGWSTPSEIPPGRRRWSRRRTGRCARGCAVPDPEQGLDPRHQPRQLSLAGGQTLDSGVHLGAQVLGVLALDDPEPRAHHLRERPERDTLPVGQRAPAMPANALGETVDVLLELPPESGFPTPGLPLTSTTRGLPSAWVAWKRSLICRTRRRGRRAAPPALPPAAPHPREAVTASHGTAVRARPSP